MHYVIYIPGLGDEKAHGQKLVVKLWRVFGVRGRLFKMNWADKKPFATKMGKLLTLIDELTADAENTVSLVAASAGASVAVLALAARPAQVKNVVCICGKLNHPETVGPHLYRQNPAFKQSMLELQDVLPRLDPTERYRIMSMHPLYDNQVAIGDTVIRGAHMRTIISAGHVFTIALCLTVLSPVIMLFIKRTDVPAEQV